MSEKQYWSPTNFQHPMGASLEMRALMAWDMLRHYGLVSGHCTREDTAGRSVLDLMPIKETVERAFALADAFVDLAESRGMVRPYTDEDSQKTQERVGELEKRKNDAEYPRGRWEENIETLRQKAEKVMGKAPQPATKPEE